VDDVGLLGGRSQVEDAELWGLTVSYHHDLIVSHQKPRGELNPFSQSFAETGQDTACY
jgi:hypothetical protein